MNVPSSPHNHQHWEGLFFAHNSSQAKQKVKVVLGKKKSFSPRFSLMHFQPLLPFRSNSNEQVLANSKLATNYSRQTGSFSTHILHTHAPIKQYVTRGDNVEFWNRTQV
jgi:hypothetical protein